MTPLSRDFNVESLFAFVDCESEGPYVADCC